MVAMKKETIWLPALRAAPLVLVAVRVTFLEAGSVEIAERVMPKAAWILLAMREKSVTSVAKPVPPMLSASREKEKD